LNFSKTYDAFSRGNPVFFVFFVFFERPKKKDDKSPAALKKAFFREKGLFHSFSFFLTTGFHGNCVHCS